MTGMIEVLQPGFGTTVQDRGRRGHRHEGVPQSGWLDGTLAEAANALVGNNGGEAVLELRGLVEAHGGGRYAATARPAPE